MITINTETCSLEMGNYYVTVQDSGRFNALLGPFPYHKQALEMVDLVIEKAHELNAESWFYSFGTSNIKNYTKPGKLNHLFEMGLK